MTILLTGGSGTIGRVLVKSLRDEGHTVKNLSRNPLSADDRYWNPANKELHPAMVEGFDAVVHLAGEGIADQRWTESRKREILDSRVAGTQLLAQTLLKAEHKPHTFICASGVGYYPVNTGVVYDETGPKGQTFLSEVCAQWESAAAAVRAAGIRLVLLRTGVVLSREGGALARMIPLFNKGIGGPIGSGKQHVSWIAMEDLVAIIRFSLMDKRLEGPVNTVAPKAATNATFAHTLGRLLNKPSRMNTPAFALKLMFGSMAEETFLADLQAKPRKLETLGFHWKHPELEPALRHVLE